jgi:hypothetical protein
MARYTRRWLLWVSLLRVCCNLLPENKQKPELPALVRLITEHLAPRVDSDVWHDDSAIRSAMQKYLHHMLQLLHTGYRYVSQMDYNMPRETIQLFVYRSPTQVLLWTPDFGSPGIVWLVTHFSTQQNLLF